MTPSHSEPAPMSAEAERKAAEVKLYATRDIEDLGERYVRHVSAMTGEGLHSKSAIAAELAWRDDRLTRAQSELAECRSKLENAYMAIDSRREQIHGFDAMPDEGLPVRILQQYIDHGTVESSPSFVGDLMMKWQRERNAIIGAAVVHLQSKDAHRAGMARTLEALKETRDALNWAHQEWMKYQLTPSDKTPMVDAALDNSWLHIADLARLLGEQMEGGI